MVRLVVAGCTLVVALSGCGRSAVTVSARQPGYSLVQMNL
jgi:hypothetical protein